MRLAPLTQFNGGMLMRFHVWILTLIMLFGSAGICVLELSKANGAGGGVDSGRSSVYTEYGAWKYTGQTRLAGMETLPGGIRRRSGRIRYTGSAAPFPSWVIRRRQSGSVCIKKVIIIAPELWIFQKSRVTIVVLCVREEKESRREGDSCDSNADD